MLENTNCLHDQQEENSITSTTTENMADSPLSGDEAYEMKRRDHTKVVSLAIGSGDDPRSKAEIHPPQDSWTWRKYGQKPIKGSPFPRGYYRCSSFKGCPARKKVERSRNNPNILLITYSWEHSHSKLTATTHQHSAISVNPASLISRTSHSTFSPDAVDVPPTFACEGFVVPDLGSNGNSIIDQTGKWGCFPHMRSSLLDSPNLTVSACADADTAVMLQIREEDQFLFGDLGELPECSVVFR